MPRYASIWFPYLLTEYVVRKTPELRDVTFVLASSQRGRMVIDASSFQAMQKGIRPGMVLADCKAIFPELEMHKSEPGRKEKVLNALAEWCIGYTPFAAVDFPDGLILDTTGCAHLWGDEVRYIDSIRNRLGAYGYTTKIAIADTIGAAWAMARFGTSEVVKAGRQKEAIRNLPPVALRLDATVLARLKKLGLQRIDSFMDIPGSALRRRFGPELPLRIRQALGHESEYIEPVKPIEPYQERLCVFEPIATAGGIKIALQKLLEQLCVRLADEGIGMRNAVFRAYRIDGDIQQIEASAGHPTRNERHIFKLFEERIATFLPDLGFEMFVLEATKVEPVTHEQAAIWETFSHNNVKIGELLDRVSIRAGSQSVKRYLPVEQYWPERSVKEADELWQKTSVKWKTDWPRPIQLLPKPEAIQVTALLPDYPPLLFRYKGKVHNIAKADGPERIEQEWWFEDGLYRDYYGVEDESGARFWVFRSGPYDGEPKWFLHGFFA